METGMCQVNNNSHKDLDLVHGYKWVFTAEIKSRTYMRASQLAPEQLFIISQQNERHTQLRNRHLYQNLKISPVPLSKEET